MKARLWGVHNILEVRELELDKIRGWIDSYLGLFWVVRRVDLRSLCGYFRTAELRSIQRILQQLEPEGPEGDSLWPLSWACICWGPVERV